MSTCNIKPGNRLPDEVNVIIEIPARSDPVKYEVDKKSGAMFVNRFMSTAMHYPCDYGYIPETLSEDSDPVDVLVLCPFPLISGSVITVRPIGILNMEDEAGPDSKLLAVPIDSASPLYKHIKSPEQVDPFLLNSIQHFFEHYKDLERGKWVRIDGWGGPEDARQEILDSIERYRKHAHHDI